MSSPWGHIAEARAANDRSKRVSISGGHRGADSAHRRSASLEQHEADLVLYLEEELESDDGELELDLPVTSVCVSTTVESGSMRGSSASLLGDGSSSTAASSSSDADDGSVSAASGGSASSSAGGASSPPPTASSTASSSRVSRRRPRREPVGELSDISGYLWKLKLGKRFKSSWKRRWFQLEVATRQLLYAANSSDAKPLGRFDLSLCAIGSHNEIREDKEWCFTVTERQSATALTVKRSYVLAADSKDEMQLWLDGLRRVKDLLYTSHESAGLSSAQLSKLARAATSAEDVDPRSRLSANHGRLSFAELPVARAASNELSSSGERALAALSPDMAGESPIAATGFSDDDDEEDDDESAHDSIYEGWLSKARVKIDVPLHARKPSKKAWKRSYFVLTRGTLTYYDVKARSHAKGLTELSPGVCVQCDNKPSLLQKSQIVYPFVVNLGNETGQVKLATSTQAELLDWTKRISEAFVVKHEKRGMLHVFDEATKKWKLRHVLLSEYTLQYFRRVQKGLFSLHDCLVDVLSPTVFMIASTAGSFQLRAEDEKTQQTWVKVLRHEIEQQQADVIKQVHSDVFSDAAKLDFRNKIQTVMAEGQRSYMRMVENAPPLLGTEEQRKRFFILSFDGGGMRGLMSAILLERLLEVFPLFLERVNLVAGCSNGAMISTAIAFNIPPSVSRTLMEITGPTIFGNPESKLMNVRQAKFENTWLRLFCDSVWGANKMHQAVRPLVVPTFGLSLPSTESGVDRMWGPKTMFSFSEEEEVRETLAADVVLRTVAAPTYFPTYQGYIDGSLYDHNPAGTALMLAISPSHLHQPLEDIVMLSFGTGLLPKSVEGDSLNWGVAQWLPRLTSILWDGMVMKTEQTCSLLLGDRYHRINPVLAEDIPMDDPKQIPELIAIAKSVNLEPTIKWMEKHLFARE